jgi:hypothetical protein
MGLFHVEQICARELSALLIVPRGTIVSAAGREVFPRHHRRRNSRRFGAL